MTNAPEENPIQKEIEEMATIADCLAQRSGRRFVLNQAKVDSYVAHNEIPGRGS